VWGRWIDGVARRLERVGIGKWGPSWRWIFSAEAEIGVEVWWDENEALCAGRSDDRPPVRHERLSIVLIGGASRLPFDFNDEDEGTQLFCKEAGRVLLTRTVIL
jgi:hypothetical protein